MSTTDMAQTDNRTGAFRPTRNRASLGALPSSSSASSSNLKENAHSTSTTAKTSLAQRKKRAQSLGGDAIPQLMKASLSVLELSPGQQRRRKAAPRRSILKTSSSAPALLGGGNDHTGTMDVGDARFNSAHTTDLSSLSSFNRRRRSSVRGAQPDRTAHDDEEDEDDDDDDGDDEEDNGTMDMEITRMTQTDVFDDRRKSLLSRRVSFAPNAHIRTFTPDKPTADAQALHAHIQAQQAAAAAAAAVAANADATTASSQAESNSWSSDEEQDEDSFESEPSMEMAADEVTHAFAGHFAGTRMPVAVLQGNLGDESDSEDDKSEDGDGSVEMDVANTGEITSAFAQQKTSVFNSQQSVVTRLPAMGPGTETARAKPRFSEVVRQEDAEDAEILRSLGLGKGSVASQSPKKRGAVMFGGVPSSDNDDATGEIDEDADTEDDRTAPMDMTTAVGTVVTVEGSAEPAQQEEADDDADISMEMSLAEKTMELDQTADMQDATSYGKIFVTDVGVPAPSTPSARLRAEMHARQIAQGITPTESPKRSPRRLSVMPHSPARPSPLSTAVVPARSPAKSPLKLSVTAPTGFSQVSPVSPMKASAASPRKIAQSPARTRSSPIKRASVAMPGATTPTRQTSPSKTTSMTPGRTPRSTFTPKVLVPPQSTGRSPGGSLSLRGLLQEQLARNSMTSQQMASPKSYPPPSSLAKSPKRRASASWDSPKAKMARLAEQDVTGSSFGGYGDDPQPPAPILSLDDFFDATGTGFMKDVLGMTGVELGSKRRKSMAPSGLGRTLSGPPSFSDLAVAGGCKSLFHQLYQSDHLRLQEEITNVMNQLAQCEEALQFEQPKVFTEWSTASDAHRLTMQNQFRMIKAHYYLVGRIEWNECRAQNHQSIIEVMEENLEGLMADNAVVEETCFDTVIPELEARRAALLAELHEERQRDVELSACDMEELGSMHAAVAEQAEELEKLERGYSEVAAQLAGLESKADDLAQQVAKSTAERDELVQKLEEGRCFTKAEVFRLQAEFDALQQLNGWTLIAFDKSGVTLRHLNEFDVTLKLGRGKVESIEFTLLDGQNKTLGTEATSFFFNSMRQQIDWLHQASPGIRARSVIRRIDAIWTCARRLRHEIQLMNRQFPTTCTVDSTRNLMTASAEVHVASKQSSFVINFAMDGEELFAEEESRPAELRHVVARLGSEIRVKFGDVDSETLQYVVRDRIDPSEMDRSGNRGALIRACQAAEAEAQSAA